MKLCAFPANTTCMYQRIARDQADPDDGAQAAQAYEELCTFLADRLDPNDLGEAEALLRRFVDQTGDGNLGTDEPETFGGQPHVGGWMERNPQVGRVEPNPPGRLSMDEMQRRVAAGARIGAGKVLARNAAFNARFPDAARIRNV